MAKRMVAVVLGGGTGTRFGAVLPKQLLVLGGRTLVEHCVAAFAAAPGIDEILLVMPPAYHDEAKRLVGSQVSAVIAGGAARSDSGRHALAHVPPRETQYRAQTPQCFRLEVIAKAHALAAADPAFTPTDDCGVVLRYLPDIPVHVVPGSEDNIKVTYPSDLEIAAALLRTRQVEATSEPPA